MSILETTYITDFRYQYIFNIIYIFKWILIDNHIIKYKKNAEPIKYNTSISNGEFEWKSQFLLYFENSFN